MFSFERLSEPEGKELSEVEIHARKILSSFLLWIQSVVPVFASRLMEAEELVCWLINL